MKTKLGELTGDIDTQVELLLQSKYMRWMLDNPSDEFEQAVKQMVTPDMIAFAQCETA